MYEWLTEFHMLHASSIKALIAGTMVSAICSLMGCFIILRRMSFLADALSHSMLAGVVAGYLILNVMFGSRANVASMLIGAMIAGFATVGMIGFVTRVSRIKQDTAIGIMYTGIFALGAFIASAPIFSKYIHVHLTHFVLGDVLAVGNAELLLMAGVSVVVVSCVLMFFRHFQLISFDPVMAASIGIPVLAVDYLLTACTSLVVVSGVYIVGVILVVALMITPAASAYLLFDRLKHMLIAAVAFGIGGFWLGYYVSIFAGTTPGSAIVLTSTGIFLMTLVVAPKYGLIADAWRKWRTVPQQMKEDVLGYVRRKQGSVSISQIASKVDGGSFGIRRAIQILAQNDLLKITNGQVELTTEGDTEATRLIRAHRLWETYLAKVGTPSEKLHETAHKLEHINNPSIVDYLDDKLGHPLQDPHGSEIPRDTKKVRIGNVVRVSELRFGNVAVVTEVSGDVDSRLTVGKEFTVGHRQKEGEAWLLTCEKGEQILLDHDQADMVFVEVVSLSS